MKWFKVTVQGDSRTIRYCVLTYDEKDAMDWVIEETSFKSFDIIVTELEDYAQVCRCHAEADFIFYGG